MKPDFMVYTPGNELLLVVEVKATKNESAEWAAKLRGNLIAHGAVPYSPFFLLVLPEHVYLWKNSTSPRESPPDFVSQTKAMLNPYLSKLGEDYSRLSESSLELAVRSWLNDMATSSISKQPINIENRLLVESGLAERLRDSALLCGDAV